MMFAFEMDFITQYDIYTTYQGLIKKRLNTKDDKLEKSMYAKIDELALLLVRMAM